ncbi:FG-GAP-like repeat-containing protein [Singulisphaera acidiphila]|nr:FG-GAP-like repeat-containing protein [Singulisphaera acidiphila]
MRDDSRAPTDVGVRLRLGRAAGVRIVAALLGLAAAGLIGAWAYRTRQYDAELTAAERALAERRPAEARDRLARLAARWPNRDEVEFPLGQAEAALGNTGAALAAFARVPADSVVAPRAALERARVAVTAGRLTEAEEALTSIVDRSDELGAEAAKVAQQVDLFSGRTWKIPGRIARRWRTAANQAGQLKAHWLADTQPLPLEAVRTTLEQMAQTAPEDDRVWLGRADLATRTGQFAEADAWLDRCEARRPNDSDVARARLAWALASARPAEAVAALTRLPAAGADPAEVASLRARLAGLRDDPSAERAALEECVALESGDARVHARLATLAAAEGRTDDAEGRRRRKAEIDRTADAYRMLMGRVPPSGGGNPPFADLARAAETLGRTFEARGWWSLRSRQAPSDPESRAALARLARSQPPAAGPARGGAGETLASLVGPVGAAPETARAEGPAVPAFRDDAEAAGLRFVYDHDPTLLRRLPETMGGGLGLLDYDGDGLLDIFCVQGGPFPAGSPSEGGGDRLFRNKGDGTFEDATTASGIAAMPRGFGHGVTVGDVDNDGFPDLFVTRWRSYALYRNRGDGTFEDATEAWGLGGERGWPTSAAFADLDGDGDLDLYVCQYLEWDPETSSPCPDPQRPGQYQYCVPRAFKAEPDRLYRNDGGRFVDVSDEAGITAGDPNGRGLGVVAADLDGDGRVDLFVANDMTANLLYRNLGGMRFEEVAEASGCASNAEGGYQAGMGIACGDVDGDGRPELAVTNFYGEGTTLYQNLGGGLFTDRTTAYGLAAPTRHVLGFGLTFLDANNDGYLDVAQANGHVNDFRPAIPFAMPAQLLLGSGRGRLVDASARAGDCWKVERIGRGLASGDLDGDGRLDVLLLAQGQPLSYLRNLGPGGRALTLGLRGTGSNRDAVGAVVRVRAGGREQVQARLGGGSFLSASDGRLHFGLGEGPADETVSAEVRWPSGRVDRHEGLKPGGVYLLVEGEPSPRPAPRR